MKRRLDGRRIPILIVDGERQTGDTPGMGRAMGYRAVIFDIYGTLLQEQPRHVMLNATIGLARQIHVDPIEFASCWFRHAHHTPADMKMPWIESNLRAVCNDFGVEIDPRLRRRLCEEREELIRQTLEPRRGALRTLTKLRAAGLRTVAIGDTPPDVQVMLKGTELSDHLDLAMLSTSGAWRHDDPRLITGIVKKLGLPADLCLYVSAGSNAELDIAASLGLTPVAFHPELEDQPTDGIDPGYHPVTTMIEVYWFATETAALPV